MPPTRKGRVLGGGYVYMCVMGGGGEEGAGYLGVTTQPLLPLTYHPTTLHPPPPNTHTHTHTLATQTPLLETDFSLFYFFRNSTRFFIITTTTIPFTVLLLTTTTHPPPWISGARVRYRARRVLLTDPPPPPIRRDNDRGGCQTLLHFLCLYRVQDTPGRDPASILVPLQPPPPPRLSLHCRCQPRLRWMRARPPPWYCPPCIGPCQMSSRLGETATTMKVTTTMEVAAAGAGARTPPLASLLIY